jgi:hypothetical protein
MKAFFHNYGKQSLLVLVITLVCCAFLFAAPAWAIGPGVSLVISTGDSDQDPTFILGSAVRLEMIIKNDTNFPINTERGFSKLEAHRFLVLIDPAGTHHVVGGIVTSGDAPPPFFLGDKTAVPAESLPAKWNKKITIEDLSKLFPVIKDNIGWYKLQTHMPFVRLVWTLQHEQLGLLGIADDERNFVGTVDSNQVQFHVVLAPDAKGAHFKVQLLDQSTDPPTPINQAPVRVYEQAIVDGLDLQEAWARGPDSADLNGLTSTEGWATWDEDLCKLQNDYTAIAYYQDEYKDVSFSKDGDTWAAQCDGVIEKTILFGQLDQGGQEVVDDLVTVSYGRVTYNRRTGQYSYAATLSNVSNTDLKGPLWLVIQNLQPAAAVVTNADGQVDANPYIEALGDGASFNSGDTLSNITIVITNTSRQRITFADQVLAVKP